MTRLAKNQLSKPSFRLWNGFAKNGRLIETKFIKQLTNKGFSFRMPFLAIVLDTWMDWNFHQISSSTVSKLLWSCREEREREKERGKDACPRTTGHVCRVIFYFSVSLKQIQSWRAALNLTRVFITSGCIYHEKDEGEGHVSQYSGWARKEKKFHHRLKNTSTFFLSR